MRHRVRTATTGAHGWHLTPLGLRVRTHAAAAARAVLLVAFAALLVRVLILVVPFVLDAVEGSRIRPPVPPVSPNVLVSLTDMTPVRVTTTRAWKQLPMTTIADRVLHDQSLWREMFIRDWDTVPLAFRERGLSAMLHAYRRALSGPAAWRTMTVADWDLIPQPVRAIAYLRMTSYWAVHEQVGAAFGLEPRRVAQTIGAIVMAESWFEHRAVNENVWGNRDLGLAQCSDYCRDELLAMASRGDIAFTPSEADYFDPFIATRIATVWFARELGRAGGDVDLAIRAYHRGIDHALDEQGDAYLERVLAERRRYVRAVQAPPAWAYLVRIAGESE